MISRFFVFAGIFALASVARLPGQTRTPDGHPDLQGFWTNATLTPLERGILINETERVMLSGVVSLTVDDKEAGDLEKKILDIFGGRKADAKPVVDNNADWFDRGNELARVNGTKRTSLIVDPVDGKVPLNAEAQKKASAPRGVARIDSASDRPVGERCLLGFGSAGGPPMLPVLYNSNYQIVQTPDYVMILVEMVHDVRFIRMGGTHAPPHVRQWLGDSIGRWEGDTLVVDTTNFTEKTHFQGSSRNLHVTERFTVTGPGAILYRATIEDPATFAQPWTVEYPLIATPNPTYEYACHEGNYAMTGILAGARKADADEAGKK